MLRWFRLLRARLWFWWLVLLGSIAVLALLILGSNSVPEIFGLDIKFIVITNMGDSAAETLQFSGKVADNDALGSIAISLCFVLITLSFIHLFKIPNIRKVAIRALATGYYENFLIGVIDTLSKRNQNFLIIIVLPNFTLIERPNIYWKGFKDVIADLGFELKQEEVDVDFGRTILTVNAPDNPSLPIRVDMPTTMKMLRIILELESEMPAGKGVEYQWWKDRFLELRNEFQKTIEQYLPEDDWGNIKFVKGDTKKEFESQIRAVMKDFIDNN